MGSTNYGTQTISVQYFDPVESAVVDRILLNIIPRGIWSGGYLTKVGDTLVTLSTLMVVLGDSTHQVRVETADAVSVTVGVSTPYVVLRWSYTTSPTNYMDVLALASGSILSTDVIVGRCTYVGSTLTGFDYGDTTWPRTTPKMSDIFLRPEPTSPASMYLRVRAGRISFGTQTYEVPDQLSPVFTAPSSSTKVDLLYVDVDGTLKVAAGTEGAGAPAYGGKFVVAEVTLAVGATSIVQANIRDCRSLVGGGGSADGKWSVYRASDGKLTLTNDSASPGTSMYYGTNSAGTRGFFAITYS